MAVSNIGWNYIHSDSQYDPAGTSELGTDVSLQLDGVSYSIRPDIAALMGAKLMYAASVAAANQAIENRMYPQED